MTLVKYLNYSYCIAFEITASRIQLFLIEGHVKDVQFSRLHWPLQVLQSSGLGIMPAYIFHLHLVFFMCFVSAFFSHPLFILFTHFFALCFFTRFIIILCHNLFNPLWLLFFNFFFPFLTCYRFIFSPLYTFMSSVVFSYSVSFPSLFPLFGL